MTDPTLFPEIALAALTPPPGHPPAAAWRQGSLVMVPLARNVVGVISRRSVDMMRAQEIADLIAPVSETAARYSTVEIYEAIFEIGGNMPVSVDGVTFGRRDDAGALREIVIAISSRAPDAEFAFLHETLHFVYRTECLTDVEYQALAAYAAEWADRYRILERYRGDLPATHTEESIADAFASFARAVRSSLASAGAGRDHRAGVNSPASSAQAGDLTADFPAAAQEIFGRVLSGEVAARYPNRGRGRDTLFGIDPAFARDRRDSATIDLFAPRPKPAAPALPIAPTAVASPIVLADIAAQERVKRALEIAAVGAFTIALVGDSKTLQLREDLARAASREMHIDSAHIHLADRPGGPLPSTDMIVYVSPTAESDLALPPPVETAAQIGARIKSARPIYATLSQDGLDFSDDELVSSARERGIGEVTAKRVQLVAVAVAALEIVSARGMYMPGRADLAEALSYQVEFALSANEGGQTNPLAPSPSDPAGTGEMFIHAGFKVYSLPDTRQGANGRAWLVQTPDNREREQRGEREVGGDTIHRNPAEAKAFAEIQARQYAAQLEMEQRVRAQAGEEQRQRDARRADDGDGFAKDLPENRRELIRLALDKQVRFTTGVSTVREWIAENRSAGTLAVSQFEELKIKPMSRARFNRATAAEQRDHARRQSEGGKVTVYLVNDIDLGKIAHDYAAFRIAQDHAAASRPQTPAVRPPARSSDPVGRAGIEYRYGARNRPPGYATVPTGFTRIEPRPERGVDPSGWEIARHGIVVYPQPLTAADVSRFELTPFLDATAIVAAERHIAAGMTDYAVEYLAMAGEKAEHLRHAVTTALRNLYPDDAHVGDRSAFTARIIEDLRNGVSQHAPQSSEPPARAVAVAAASVSVVERFLQAIEEEEREVSASSELARAGNAVEAAHAAARAERARIAIVQTAVATKADAGAWHEAGVKGIAPLVEQVIATAYRVASPVSAREQDQGQ